MSFALSPFDDLPTAGRPCSGRTGGAGSNPILRRLFLHSDAQRVERPSQRAAHRSFIPNHEGEVFDV